LGFFLGFMIAKMMVYRCLGFLKDGEKIKRLMMITHAIK
jgi:hypothetical protein